MGNNTNKLILLVVSAVALLLALNIYQKQVGKNVAVVLSIVTIVVVGYVAFNLMADAPLNNSSNNVQLNNVNLNSELLNNNPVNNIVNLENNTVEGFYDGHEEEEEVPRRVNMETFEGENTEVEENVGEENVNADNNVSNNNPVDNGVMKCSDLLPMDTNSTWAQVSPSGVGDLCTKNLLNSGHHLGVNTTGTSLRNANRQIRSEPPCPQVNVSPWLQTTIAPDLLRRPLE